MSENPKGIERVVLYAGFVCPGLKRAEESKQEAKEEAKIEEPPSPLDKKNPPPVVNDIRKNEAPDLSCFI